MPKARSLRDALHLVRDLAFRDPPFVRGGPIDATDIPVFTFHSLEPLSFERRLQHLARNGYSTLSLADYERALRGDATFRKSVLLTFDDGRATTWTVAFPLLQRFGFRGVAFLVTSVVHESHEVGSLYDGRAEPGIEREARGERPFVTWGEVQRMSTVLDAESHTHRHALIPIGRKRVATLQEANRRGYAEFDVPFVELGGNDLRGSALPPGHPLPLSAPRLSHHRRVFDDRIESESERREAILQDLTLARAALHRECGSAARSLCYPWHVAAPDVPGLAREAGHTVAFSGKAVGGNSISRPGDDLFRIARVGEDYVERLPGDGRRPLASVLKEKLLRRR